MEMSRLTQDGTGEPVSRDQILRRERGQGNIHFSCSADHMQDCKPYPVDPYSCYLCDHTILLFLPIHALINMIMSDDIRTDSYKRASGLDSRLECFDHRRE